MSRILEGAAYMIVSFLIAGYEKTAGEWNYDYANAADAHKKITAPVRETAIFILNNMTKNKKFYHS